MKIKLTDINMLASDNHSREDFLPEDCSDLAGSMDTVGQLIPVRVRKLESGKWKLIYGFRRHAAAHALGWAHLDAVEATEDEESDGVCNLVENMVRQDLSLWEQCVAIKSVFPQDTSHAEIGFVLGKSRGWVRPRRRIWELEDYIQLQVQRGELSIVDLEEFTRLDKEDRIAKSQAMKEETTSSTQRAPRVHPRSIKQLRRLQTQVYSAGREDWNSLIKFQLGEIDDEELFRLLDFEPEV